MTEGIAGPYGTKLLAEFGAEVVKIERPDCGDVSRTMGPFLADRPHGERSGLFLYLNMGKRSVTLDLKAESGRRILRELVREADVVVESFGPGVMAELGLAYPDLEAINPRLVMTAISDFGQTGPYRDYKATDIVSLALGGFMYQTGEPDREPLKTAGDHASYIAGMAAALGTVAALHLAEERGLGQHVDVSTMEAVINCLDFALVLQTYNGVTRGRVGNRHPLYQPVNLYPCKDGYVSFNVAMTHHWENLCSLLGRPELIEDGRFLTPEDRVRNVADLDAILIAWLAGRTKQEVTFEAQRARVPAGATLTVDELFGDPQYVVTDFFTEVDHPETGPLTYPGAPFQMTQTPWQSGRAPLLGEHNEEVLCGQLGYSKQDLVKLRERGII